MYNKILVPLDGSDLAESVLPHVEAITGGCKVSDVTFVRVVDKFSMPSGSGATLVLKDADVKNIESERKKKAKEYLENLAKNLKWSNVSISTEVLMGSVAESVADYAKKNTVDLIIIATHGRSGITRWAMGSVADRIMRSACVPVLMVRAPGCVSGF